MGPTRTGGPGLGSTSPHDSKALPLPVTGVQAVMEREKTDRSEVVSRRRGRSLPVDEGGEEEQEAEEEEEDRCEVWEIETFMLNEEASWVMSVSVGGGGRCRLWGRGAGGDMVGEVGPDCWLVGSGRLRAAHCG